MIVLGIDPGFGKVGWGIVRNEKGKQTIIDYGCLETNPKSALEERLADIYKNISSLIDKYKPTEVAIEDLFFGNNVTTALSVGQARGVIMLSAYKKGIPISFYKPAEVKMAVAGYGQSTKPQIQYMVKTILKMEKIPKPDDAADALAIALTHCFSQKLKAYL